MTTKRVVILGLPARRPHRLAQPSRTRACCHQVGDVHALRRRRSELYAAGVLRGIGVRRPRRRPRPHRQKRGHDGRRTIGDVPAAGRRRAARRRHAGTRQLPLLSVRPSPAQPATGIEHGAECGRYGPLLSALADGEASAEELARLRYRSSEWRKSSGRTGAPFEKRTPRPSSKTYLIVAAGTVAVRADA
jgi:hypothetical protein